MQTPNTIEGRITEQIMIEWRAVNTDADSTTYNRTWSETLKIVTAKMAVDRMVDNSMSSPKCRVIAAGVIVAGPSLLETLACRRR